MIYVGIDDTDSLDAPGTNKLARSLIHVVSGEACAAVRAAAKRVLDKPVYYECVVAVRHQLLFDQRIPYTRKNSCTSILLKARDAGSIRDLAGRLRREMLERFVEGSDPGLCVSEQVPPEVTEFGRRCQREVVDQREARRLAAACDIHLEGLGGTEDGVIGAIAAVGLLAGGNDGRVVNIGNRSDDLTGPQDASLLLVGGVGEIRCVDTGELIREGTVDVGKRLRPNYRDGKIVLLVTESSRGWRAVRFP